MCQKVEMKNGVLGSIVEMERKGALSFFFLIFKSIIFSNRSFLTFKKCQAPKIILDAFNLSNIEKKN